MQIPCASCGQVVYKRPRDLRSSKSGNVFCSALCAGKSIRIQRPPCKVCGTIVSRLGQRTCSKACSNRSRTGIKYGQGEPRNKRRRISKLKELLLRERGSACERCGLDESAILVVHHQIERAHGGADSMDNLELLCPNCHARHHYGSDPVG